MINVYYMLNENGAIVTTDDNGWLLYEADDSPWWQEHCKDVLHCCNHGIDLWDDIEQVLPLLAYQRQQYGEPGEDE